MKKLSKKSVLLFAAAMAVCALAPSMASAASWSVIGSHHTLDSPDFGITILSSAIGTACGESFFTTNVRNAADMQITSAVFRRCTSSGSAIGSCTTTSTATSLPWTAVPTSTITARVEGVRIDVLLENHPGSTACGAAGVKILFTGNIDTGSWDNASKSLTVNTVGLVSHSALGNNVNVSVHGSFRDTPQTLQILP